MWTHILCVAGLCACASIGLAAQMTKSDPFEAKDQWHIAQYDFDHPVFDTDWRRAQVMFDDGVSLHIEPHQKGVNSFVSGSIRRHETSHFGSYSARLKAAKGDGLVTGFFTYTGPAYGTRHDEIDFEILGQDTTRVQIGWFTDGVHQSQMIDLGFDAADGFHSYRFEWSHDRIVWFVDEQRIATSDFSQVAVPQTPSYAFVNLWAVSRAAFGWAGVPDQRTRASAHFKDFGYDAYLTQ